MTGWIADNEFDDHNFCEIHQLPKIFKFSYELSLLTLSFCAAHSRVVESIGKPMMGSATSDMKSFMQNDRMDSRQ